MKEGCDVWLSKARPPKSLKKTPVANIKKGPLSRNTPPRGMLSNSSLRNATVAYLTQNSPPPTQLKTARKQSTLNDYFGIKEDKCKPGIKEAASARRERAPSPLATTVQGFPCEHPFLIGVQENNGDYIYKETSFRHSLHQNYMKDQSLFSENCKASKEKDLTCYKNDPMLQLQPNLAPKKFDSAITSSENCCTVMHCGCNKENILEDCKIERSSYLKQDTSSKTVTCCKELSFEHHNSEMLPKEIRPRTINNADELTFEHHNSEMLPKEIGPRTINNADELTFSEGLKFLSQEDTIECDNVGSIYIGHNHSLAKERDYNLVPTKCDNMSFKRLIKSHTSFDRFIKEKNSIYEQISISSLQPEVDDCDSLGLKEDVQTGSQDILSLIALDKHTSSTLGHIDRDVVRMLRDSDRDQDSIDSNAVRMLQDSDRDQDSIDSNAVRMLQDSDRDQDSIDKAEVRMLQDSDRDQDSIDKAEVRMLQDSDRDQDSIDKAEVRMLQDSDRDQDSIDKAEVRMLQDSDRDQDSEHDCIDFTISNLSDDRVALSPRDCTNTGVLQNGSLQVGNTPDFTEESSSVECDADGASVYSQLSVLRRDEFQRKKQQYMSDIGTISFSENM